MNRIVGTAMFVLLLSVMLATPLFADARSAYLQGTRAQAVEDYELAIEKYKDALDLNPAYLEPTIGLAESFFLLEEYDESAKFVARARTLDRNSSDLAILDARIHIGLGDIAAARRILAPVLSSRPNDVEARLALSEIEIAEGRYRNALDHYQQTLKLAPESRKALLSLAMLCDELGDAAGASRYYELVLRGNSSDPHVQLAVARWCARTGDLATAEKRAKIALSLNPDMNKARLLLAEAYLRTSRFTDAATVLKEIVSTDRDDAIAWYEMGLAYRGAKDAAKALSSFASGLAVRPEDEIARVVQENTAIDSLPLEDEWRKKAGAWHLEQGASLAEKNYLEKALAEFRRTLILDPTSRDGRVAYARIFKSFGFPDKYLSELKVLASLGAKDTLIQDEIEGISSSLADSLSRSWGYDQYNLERPRFHIPVFTIAERNRLVHPLASAETARYFAALLSRYETISVPEGSTSVASFDEAFRKARAAGTDWFVVLRVDEAERSFSASADLYLSRTGSHMAGFSAFRTGNDRVRDAFLKITSQLAAQLPVRATLLKRKFDRGVINAGTFQGVKKDDTLVIVRKGAVRLNPDKTSFLYDEKDWVGNLTVISADEGVSEGTVERRGYFDYVNPGDEVLFAIQKPEAEKPLPTAKIGNILTRLFRINK